MIFLQPPLIFSRQPHPGGINIISWMEGDHTHIFAEIAVIARRQRALTSVLIL